MRRFRYLLAAALAMLGGGAAVAAYTQPLGGSIFPLVYVTQPVTNLEDAYNEMLALINAQIGGVLQPVTPGGRISLSGVNAVMEADFSSVAQVNYLPYTSEQVPINTGSGPFQAFDIGASGLALTLNSTDEPATNVYDIYAVNVAGSPTLCAMSWGGTTARSTTAGGTSAAANASIAQVNGIWTNNAAIATANCYNGTTSYVIPQNQGTMLGSIYVSSSGHASWVCNPAGASGGTLLDMGVSNAYNRVPVTCSNSDTAVGPTSSSASWALLGATDDAVFLDTLKQTNIAYSGFVVAGNATITDFAQFGIAIGGGGTGTPAVIAAAAANSSTLANNYTTLDVQGSAYSSLGTNFLFAEKASSAGTTTYMPVSTYENMTVTASY